MDFIPNIITTPVLPSEALPSSLASASRPKLSQDKKVSDVHIDVKGAYIISDDEEKQSEQNVDAGEAEWRKEEDYQHDTRDIRLPHQRSGVSHMAIDIGGSLIKLCYWMFEDNNQALGGRLVFRKFPTDRIDSCIEFMKYLAAKQSTRTEKNSPVSVVVTGGGGFKFYDKIKEELGVDVVREDEMKCLIIGLNFFISQVEHEVFEYSDRQPYPSIPPDSQKHPYLLVNIGSGVSMLKVSGPTTFERVGGTSLGGGTLWGLLSLLTGARTFEDMLRLAEKGDNTKVDMLVGDIYGADYSNIGLKATTIASSMGKVFRTKREAEREAEDHGGMNMHHDDGKDAQKSSATNFLPEDISKSLLYAVSNNIGQLAYLHAEKHGCDNVYFGGSFIGGHWQTMATLSYAIKYWSKETKAAYFLQHEGYLGAVGAFLCKHVSDIDTSQGRRASLDGLVASLSRVTTSSRT